MALYIVIYQDPAGHAVNSYVAYDASQCSGASAHSPRSCLPQGGCLMELQDPVTLDPELTRRDRITTQKIDELV